MYILPNCNCAHKSHQFVDTFVYEIGREEKDLAKRQKIDDLRLSDREWEQIGLFNDLLAVRCTPYPTFSFADIIQHADNAQQAFSSDQATTLHRTLPALEALHKAWTKRAERSKYLEFVPALNAGLAKIEEYYHRTAESDAYTFAMCSIPNIFDSSLF